MKQNQSLFTKVVLPLKNEVFQIFNIYCLKDNCLNWMVKNYKQGTEIRTLGRIQQPKIIQKC